MKHPPAKIKKCDLIAAFLDKHPDMPSLTAARILFSKHPAVWSSIENARISVRFARGAQGNRHRHMQRSSNPNVLVPRYDNKFSIPPSQAVPLLPFVVPPEVTNLLVMCDHHIPYHDPRALEAQIEYGLAEKCDGILINGDLMDCHELSKFDKHPDKKRFAAELRVTFEYLYRLRCLFPDAPIYWKLGNHEDRFYSYLLRHAPALWKLDCFSWERMASVHGEEMTLSDLDITVIEDKRIVLFNELKILHGHEYRTGFAEPVNPARGMFLRTKDICMVGHWHQSSEHQERTLGGKFISCWSVGCGCELTPAYSPYNKWVHGVASVKRRVGKDGRQWWKVDNRKIIAGEVV